jgi:hypothetical protein
LSSRQVRAADPPSLNTIPGTPRGLLTPFQRVTVPTPAARLVRTRRTCHAGSDRARVAAAPRHKDTDLANATISSGKLAVTGSTRYGEAVVEGFGGLYDCVAPVSNR